MHTQVSQVKLDQVHIDFIHEKSFYKIISLFSLCLEYGRTCKDIGCLDNEVCVMESKPCGYYDAQNECGQ